MPICQCSICVATSTYEDDYGDEAPGADLSRAEYNKHQLVEQHRVQDVQDEAAGEDVGVGIILATLGDGPDPDALLLRHRDTSDEEREIRGIATQVCSPC